MYESCIVNLVHFHWKFPDCLFGFTMHESVLPKIQVGSGYFTSFAIYSVLFSDYDLKVISIQILCFLVYSLTVRSQ